MNPVKYFSKKNSSLQNKGEDHRSNISEFRVLENSESINLKSKICILLFSVFVFTIATFAFSSQPETINEKPETVKYDLALQRDIYRYTNYTGSRALSKLILLDVQDSRSSQEKNGGLLQDQTTDKDWKRPLPIMLSDLFTTEMQRASLIKLIPATSDNLDYRLTLKIISLYAGTKENSSNSGIKHWFAPRIAHGYADLQIILSDKSGKEISNTDFIANAQQELGRFSNNHLAAVKVLGLALRESIASFLQDLDSRLQLPK